MRKLIIELQPRAQCTLPSRVWRVVWRECTQRGLSRDRFQPVREGTDLTFDKAQRVFRRERQARPSPR